MTKPDSKSYRLQNSIHTAFCNRLNTGMEHGPVTGGQGAEGDHRGQRGHSEVIERSYIVTMAVFT